MSNPSIILPQSPAFAENNVYAARVEDGAVPLYNVLPLDFTRASNGTRVNKDGLIENMPYNLLEQSNTFNTTWTINGTGTLTSGQGGYDETNNAWRFDKSASSTYLSQPSTSLGINTFSIYAKAGTNTHIAFWIRNANQGKFFDLANGTVGSDFVGTPIDAQIQSMGNGWYRCSIVANGADNNCRIYPADADGDVSGTSGNIYIQDAQLVKGSTAKPYLATTDRLDMPRITYPIGGGCGSLLLEPQRTNLCTYSQDFSNAAWATSIDSGCSLTITPNYTTASNGLPAARLVASRTNTSTLAILANYSPNTTTSATKSIWMKNNNAGNVTIMFGDTAVTITDSWERYSVTNTYPYAIVGLRYSGAALSCDISITGSQFEVGSYATSYIPTTSAAATRVGDRLSRSGLGFTDSTFVINFTPLNDTVEVLDFQKLGGARMFYIAVNSVKFITFNSVSGGTIGIVGSQITINQTCKLAFTLNASTSNVTVFINGLKTGTYATDITTFDRFSQLETFGYAQGTKIEQIKIFPSVLTDSECITLTTL